MRIDKMNFNKNELINAKIQAETLAYLESNGGRYNVIELDNGCYKVVFDECQIRDGVDEKEIIYTAYTNCNSGTYNVADAKRMAKENVLFA